MSKLSNFLDKYWIMNKPQELMAKYIPEDKWYHFCVGMALGGGTSWSVESGLIIGTSTGVAKELYDKYIKKTKFDWKDLLATVIGTIVGVALRYWIRG